MGMSYQFCGSASYPRFGKELLGIAAVFGGVETAHPRGDDEPWFVFPEGTNETLVEWFNDIYGDKKWPFGFTAEETAEVWKCVSEHPEIREISGQIWEELKICVDCGVGWSITH